ncbi:leucine-rich repeat neuronal protein 4 [Hyalella azteca]|uniref:Leucine-rich repeat neuronal protein 4 n=1 Tax=Hyalella azteca TaxID=294128 RepID=A0A8B7PA03_HYAAZ|nr:leucine-rich repeat neuronal protein 4 [Hyalella azteca]
MRIKYFPNFGMDFEACKPPPKRWTNTVAPCHRTRQRPIHFWVTGALWLQICTSFALLVSGTDGFCPRGCSCNDVNVDCVGAGLEVVPIMLNPSVVAINLASNRIQSLQESLNFYPDLVTLELSSNQLTSLGVNNFQGQAILRTLNLDSNSLNLLLDGSFLGLSNLRILTINNNQLTKLNANVFRGLDSLEQLELVNNKIKEVDSLGFEYLYSLRRINLARNRLHRVPISSLNNLASLHELDLCDNQISIVPERAFQHLANLTHLNLNKNNISSILPDSFFGLEKLQNLSLLDNRLTQMPTSSFYPLTQVTSLDVSGNMFSSLPRDFLGNLPSLTLLKIERCPRLEIVCPDAFVSGWLLQELSLRQNTRLRVLPPAALAPLLALKKLDLSSCGLEALQPTQVPMRELRVLDVSGNPLHCNCSLVWLAQVATNRTLAPGSPSLRYAAYSLSVPLRELGSGACGAAVGPWTIAGCVGVALAGLVTILAFLACRWRRGQATASQEADGKSLQFSAAAVAERSRQREFNAPLSSELPHMQVYSSPSYYSASAPPVQFIYPSPRQPLHSCPSDCPCMRQSPALRPLLRTPSSTPTQSRILDNQTPMTNNLSPHLVDFPPPPPTRPIPSVSPPHVSPLHAASVGGPHHVHHYKYPPHVPLGMQHSYRLPVPIGSGPQHLQLLSTDWLYGDDPQHHWYASIDRSSSSAGAGNESSGYWEEDKELPTASLLPPGHNPQQKNAPSSPSVEDKNIENKKRSPVEEEVVPVSYI